MKPHSLGTDEVIARLASAREPGPFALAFDADGTLWSGDVGEDTFEHATSRGLLREEARPALQSVAQAHGLPTDATPSELAASIFLAYTRGHVEEKLTCEVMTWGYAGHSEDELRSIALEAFSGRGLAARRRAVLDPIFDWVRREGGVVMVISASPRVVVEAALETTGIRTDLLVAGVAATEERRILPRMGATLPYGPSKRLEGERLLRTRGHAAWLGSFGDNGFDVEMLRAAKVGVAVCPKPALRSALPRLPNTVVLC